MNGIEFTRSESQIEPPVKVVPPGEELPPEIPAEELPRPSPAKVLLHPSVVRIPMRLEGKVLASATKWEGWEYDEETLNDLADLAAQSGIELSPAWQFGIVLITAHLVKFAGYMAWRRSQKAEEVK